PPLYALSLHDALPISSATGIDQFGGGGGEAVVLAVVGPRFRSTRSLRMFSVSSRSGSIAGSFVPSSLLSDSESESSAASGATLLDRKSTRLNSSHRTI